MRESWLDWWTRPRRAFVLIGVFFGTILVMMIPPFQSADEPLHFLRAWQITDGVFVVRQTDARGMAVGEFPKSLYDIWLPFSHVGFHPEVKVDVGEIRRVLRVPLNADERMVISLGSMAHYSPVSYFPQCLGIILGRAVGATPLAMLYLAREANLLVWILFGYWSLRIAPAIGRPTFLLLLIPMSLYVASTVSADAPTNAIGILYTAVICGCATREGPGVIGGMRFVALVALSVAVGLCKFGYFPMLALVFLIPAERFGSRVRAAVKFAAVIGAGAVAAICWAGVSSGVDSRVRLTGHVSGREQLQWLLHHPLFTGPLLAETIREKGWYLAQTFVGLIGWSDVFLPGVFVIGYLGILAAWCCIDEERKSFPSAIRAVVVVIPAVVGSFLFISLLDYMYWTPVGANSIDGIHGRYLIPLGAAVFILLRSMRLRVPGTLNWREETMNRVCCGVSILSCMMLVGMVWRRFF